VAAGMGSKVGSDGLASEAVAVAGELLTALRHETDTDQSPTALAWSAHVSPRDRLTAAGPIGQPGGLDLEIDPCSDCRDEAPIEGDLATGRNSFASDSTSEAGSDFNGMLEGDWESPEPDLNIDPATMHPVTLRIHVHR